MKKLFYIKLIDVLFQILATIIPLLFFYQILGWAFIAIYTCLGAVQVISAICQSGKKSQFYWDRYRNGYNKALKVHMILALIFSIIILLLINFDISDFFILLTYIYLAIMLFSSWIFALFYFIISVMETRKLYFRAFHKPIIR